MLGHLDGWLWGNLDWAVAHTCASISGPGPGPGPNRAQAPNPRLNPQRPPNFAKTWVSSQPPSPTMRFSTKSERQMWDPYHQTWKRSGQGPVGRGPGPWARAPCPGTNSFLDIWSPFYGNPFFELFRIKSFPRAWDPSRKVRCEILSSMNPGLSTESFV